MININTLDHYRAVMGEDAHTFIVNAIDTYLKSAVDLVAMLQESLLEDDVKIFERAAYTLKSSSAAVGAKEVFILTAELEKGSKSGPLARLQPKVTRVAEESAKAEIELKAIRENLGKQESMDDKR